MCTTQNNLKKNREKDSKTYILPKIGTSSNKPKKPNEAERGQLLGTSTPAPQIHIEETEDSPW